MSRDLIIISVIVIVGFATLFYLLKKWLSELSEKQKPSEELLTVIKLLQSGSKDDRKVLLETLQQNTQALNQRLDNAARVIGLVQKNIGEMSEIGRGMKDLQDFLKSPKLRGNIGEQILKELLGQMLPKQSFHLQYVFKSGAIVDAAIVTGNGIVPIDSKFPMENFNLMHKGETEAERNFAKKQFIQDVKKHIEDISRKYILPEEGTMDFAFMFIPSEAIYYDLLINKVGAVKVNTQDLIQYAFKDKHVIIVSPTSFLAYLQTLLQGLRALKIEESAKEIRQRVEELGKHLLSYESYMKKLGSHIGTTVNTYNNAYKELGKIDRDVLRIAGEAPGIEPVIVHKPESEEE